MIKFIHAADLHLDTPFLGLREISEDLLKMMRQAPFDSLHKIVDQAIQEDVDFVLLAGDLYNTQKINIKAQSTFIKELKRLEKKGIPVFLIRGNHDFLSKDSKKLTLQLPENVYVYSKEVSSHTITTKNDKKVAVTAFSYESQWIHERKIQEYPTRLASVDLQIGMLHGALESENGKEGHYAPFTLDELSQKNYDYWALGHIHQRQQLAKHPLAVYPGNIQGLHRNEKGPKGCYLVEWSPRGTDLTFIPTAPIIWEEIKIELADLKNINQLIQRVQESLEEKGFIRNYLIHLQVEVTTEDDEKLIDILQEPSFPEDLANQLTVDNVWIADIELLVNKISEQRALEELYPDEWQKALDDVAKRTQFTAITEDILTNIPRKYLTETNTADYRQRMIQKAMAKIYLKE